MPLILVVAVSSALAQSRGSQANGRGGGRGGGWGDEKRELTLPIALAIATAARNQAENCDAPALAGHIAGFLSAAGEHYEATGKETKRDGIRLEPSALSCLDSALDLLQSQGKLGEDHSANIRASYRQ